MYRYPAEQVHGFGHLNCGCKHTGGPTEFIVLTGGPGAGKTAVLEMVLKEFCRHVTVIPESASIIFGGGFFRRNNLPAKKGAQRAIFKVQNELETIVKEEAIASIGVCDRGTLDGLAYWPESEQEFWKQLNSTKEKEYARYKAVIHLRTPRADQGYNWDNPVRVESVEEALAIDEKLLQIWSGHPDRHIIESHNSFMEKMSQAIEAIRSHLPDCCQEALKKHR